MSIPSKVHPVNKMYPRTVAHHSCLVPIEIEQIIKSLSSIAMWSAWVIVIFLILDVTTPVTQVDAGCAPLEEQKVGQLTTMFKESTSSETEQILKERNKTPPEVRISTDALENCTLPMAYVMAQQRNRSQPVVRTFNSTHNKAAPNDPEYLEFVREIREKHMTIFDVQTADEMSRIVFKNHEPRWIDICQARPDRNETWLTIDMGDPALHHSPALIEKDRRERGTFIKQVAAHRGHTLSPQAQYELDILSKAETSGTTPSSWTPASYTPKARRRRSISSMDTSETLKGAAGRANRATIIGQNKKANAALIYKKPVGKLASKSQWSAKKTTFSFNPVEPTNNRLANHYNFNSKGRYFVAPAEESHKAHVAVTTTLSTEEKERVERRINELVLEMFQIDIRVAWFLNHALNTLNHVKEHLAELKGIVIEKGATEVSSGKLQHIGDLNRKWFPRLDDLSSLGGERVPAKEARLFNVDGGVYDKRHRMLLLNLTQYVQFFGVALEQMKYDQLHLNVSTGTNDTLYRSTDRLLNKLQCETESVMKRELEFSQKRSEFERLHAIHQPSSIANLDDFYKKLVNHKLSRDGLYTGGELESPIARAFVKLSDEQQRRLILKMATYSPEMELRLKLQRERNETNRIIRPRHLWREIMPLEARQIADPKERAARDLDILNELSPTLDCYESILLSSFV